MAHNNHIIDGINKDLSIRNRDEWLKITKNWEDPYGIPEVSVHEGVHVVRDATWLDLNVGLQTY